MGIGRKGFFGLVTVTGVSAGAFWAMKSSKPQNVVKTLNSTEFNALHDQKLAAKLLSHKRSPSKSGSSSDAIITLYMLMGCPFCAKVKMVLDASRIPYEQVVVDPLNGSGIVDERYPLVPQLRFSSPAETAAPFVVDSASIISLIAVTYGFQKQLTDPRIQQTRSWLTDRFQGVTFAAINGTWLSAYYAYPNLVPESYRNVVFRLVGASALYGLARFKILPRLKDSSSSEVAQQKLGSKDITGWLLEESKGFTARLLPDRKAGVIAFHGGDRPDLADVEMYGVMQAVARHPVVGPSLVSTENDLGKWFARMESTLATSAQPLLS